MSSFVIHPEPRREKWKAGKAAWDQLWRLAKQRFEPLGKTHFSVRIYLIETGDNWAYLYAYGINPDDRLPVYLIIRIDSPTKGTPKLSEFIFEPAQKGQLRCPESLGIWEFEKKLWIDPKFEGGVYHDERGSYGPQPVRCDGVTEPPPPPPPPPPPDPPPVDLVW